jgi:hypothetical protein
MRIDSSVTSISWIPSEAVTGITKGAFEVGVAHYDEAPPDLLGPDIAVSLEALREADRFRFANHLAAFAEFAPDGSFVASGDLGGGRIGSTTVRLGRHTALERQLSSVIMRGAAKSSMRSLKAGRILTEQGAVDDEQLRALSGGHRREEHVDRS